MESAEIGDYVVIDCQDNRYYGEGAAVVSEPFNCEINGIMTQVVSVKLYRRNYGFDVIEDWKEIIMIMSLGKLKPDTERKFEMKRLERKFGQFRMVYFLKGQVDPQKECAVCHNSARKRIEVNIWTSIYQYDVCPTCAKKYDGILTDGLPLKPSEENKKATA